MYIGGPYMGFTYPHTRSTRNTDFKRRSKAGVFRSKKSQPPVEMSSRARVNQLGLSPTAKPPDHEVPDLAVASEAAATVAHAREESRRTHHRTVIMNNHGNEIERLMTISTALLSPQLLVAHESALRRSLEIYAAFAAGAGPAQGKRAERARTSADLRLAARRSRATGRQYAEHDRELAERLEDNVFAGAPIRTQTGGMTRDVGL